jgi:squalene-associated FAD-dependent desaturase
MFTHSPPPQVAVVGGGLAGLAAAAALAERGVAVELFESRRQLGGRAGSFVDPATGEKIDHCQHVGMGCCTNLLDLCDRTGLAPLLRRDRVLHFFDESGRRFDVSASPWLPAPLHLAPALLRLGFLTWRERRALAAAIVRLARCRIPDSPQGPTMADWLRSQGQSHDAIERFWATILVSALGERLEHISLPAARKVFVDGFFAARRAYHLVVPTVPLAELYGRLADWLQERGVRLHLGTAVAEVGGDAAGAGRLKLGDGAAREFTHCVIAVPWRRAAEVLHPSLAAALPELSRVGQWAGCSITGLHLWFDVPITSLPHAVLPGRLSQWVFARPGGGAGEGHYYQVVISASRALAERDRAETVEQVRGELAAIWPAVSRARLLRWRMVTEPNAVFSPRPGMELLRPPQRTAVANLFLAGDWTRTGWPSTMESAARSGYLAAEGVLAACGRPDRVLVPDLPRGRLARWLMGE